jgi:hypothetical protein
MLVDMPAAQQRKIFFMARRLLYLVSNEIIGNCFYTVAWGGIMVCELILKMGYGVTVNNQPVGSGA